MTISNELSAEIATALLTRSGEQSLAPEDLQRVVEEIHETLQRLDEDNRKPIARAASATSTPIHKPD